MRFRLCKLVPLILAVLLGCQGVTQAGTTDSEPMHVSHKPEQIRAWHFVLRRVSLERARWMVDLAHAAGFNTAVVAITDGVQLNNAPWTNSPDSWSEADFTEWIEYAKSSGMEVVPELKLLTHQEKFFQNHYPQYMFNRVTYDPRNEEVYEQVFQFLDKIINLINPRAIHIGHDEVAGHNKKSGDKWLRHGEPVLPANLFLEDILRIYGYLEKKDIETWMWGDMLISQDEFPTMKYSLHGNSPGYGKLIRDKLPRDIVICDWHYFNKRSDFPSLSTMQSEGFRVIGTTWRNETTIRNFSLYAEQYNAYGMMATTWWYVQKKQWNIVQGIIAKSGRIFRHHELVQE